MTAGYGAIEVLRSMSIGVAVGERVGLLGPNGHGKTTFLRTISGLMRPRAGSIEFDGSEISRCSPREIVARGLVHVSQGNTLFPRMTVLESLLLGAYSKRAWPHRAQNLERVYELFPRLRERAGQACGTLSGGERQMAAIGIGLMAMPKLLMLDEPTLGLAPKIRDDLGKAIGAIADAGITLVVVDQDLEFLLGLCQRLYLVTRGVVETELERETLSEQDVLAMYFGTARA